MKRTLAIYVLLLAASLVWAYMVWTDEDSAREDGEAVVILEASHDDLVSLRYESDEVEVILEVQEDEIGDYVWVQSNPKDTGEPAPPEPPPPADPHAPTPDLPEREPTAFKAGAGGDVLVQDMAPLLADRVLEGVDESKLEELGLDPPDAVLTIERKDREAKSFEVGGGVYGGKTIYLRDPESGTIYVADAKLVRPFKNASGLLMDRTLFAIPQKEIAKVTVRAGEASATFVQHNPADTRATFWAGPEQTEANEVAGGWLDKALRLKASRYIPAADEPAGLEEVFSMTISTAGRKQADVTVYRGWGEDSEESWFARSNHTRALVELRRAGAADTATDVGTVLDSAG